MLFEWGNATISANSSNVKITLPCAFAGILKVTAIHRTTSGNTITANQTALATASITSSQLEIICIKQTYAMANSWLAMGY